MPGQMSFEKEGSGVVVTWTGDVSGDEIKKMNETLYTQDRGGRLRYQIWDFTQVERLNVSIQDASDLAMQDKMAAQKNPDQIVALVGNRALFAGDDELFHVYE